MSDVHRRIQANGRRKNRPVSVAECPRNSFRKFASKSNGNGKTIAPINCGRMSVKIDNIRAPME